MMVYRFLERTNERRYEDTDTGDVFIWDIDKTYLETRFSSMRGLLRIPLEFAIDKESVPGTVPLLRALRRGAGKHSALHPIYFVSGSPLQMRKVIERKMTLDGVQFDGITFKDQWGLLRARTPKAIKEQVGYKLIALLLYKKELPDGMRFTLFGDDVESDAEAFTLFGEVCAGMRQRDLDAALMKAGTAQRERDACLELAANAQGVNPVDRIYIHLARKSSPKRYANNEKVTPTYSFLQSAMCLARDKKIRHEDVAAVVKHMRRARVSERDIESHVADAKNRLGIDDDIIEWTKL